MLALKYPIDEGKFDDICVVNHRLYALENGKIYMWDENMEKSLVVKNSAKFISSTDCLYMINKKVSVYKDNIKIEPIIQPDSKITSVFKVGSCIAVGCENGKVYIYIYDEFYHEFDTSQHSSYENNLDISFIEVVFVEIPHKIPEATIKKEYLMIGNKSGEVFIYFEGEFHSMISAKPWGCITEITCIKYIGNRLFICTKNKAVIYFKYAKNRFIKIKTIYNVDGYVRQLFSLGHLYVLTSTGALIRKKHDFKKWNSDKYVVMSSVKTIVFNENFCRVVVCMDGAWGKGLYMFSI